MESRDAIELGNVAGLIHEATIGALERALVEHVAPGTLFEVEEAFGMLGTPDDPGNDDPIAEAIRAAIERGTADTETTPKL